MQEQMELEKSLASIDEKVAKIPSFRPLFEDEKRRLCWEFLVEYTYNSNAIEGNHLSLRETDMVLKGMTIGTKPLQDHLEAWNHKEAFLFVREMAEEKRPLTESLLLQIHALVLADQRHYRGRYRPMPVRILGSDHEPVQPYLIQPKMEALLHDYLEGTDHRILRLARFHLDFESIHPFADGNGRTGRLLVNFELMKAGYLPIDIKFTDQSRYYQAFDSYHQSGSADAMESLFAHYLNERLDWYLTLLEDREKFLEAEEAEGRDDDGSSLLR